MFFYIYYEISLTSEAQLNTDFKHIMVLFRAFNF
jgi:hypothetical protein